MDDQTWQYVILLSFLILLRLVEGVAKCDLEEKQALLKFKEGLAVDGLESWREGEDCCTWSGVTCNNITGYVIQLRLLTSLYNNSHESSTNERIKVVDPALLKLKHLQYLDLGQHYPKGARGALSIPQFLGSFNELRYLNLSGSVIGEIPQTLGNLSKLEVLDLSKGDAVYAKGFGWLSGLRALKLLNLNRVKLDEVGDEWMEVLGSLQSLEELYLEACNLPGTTSTDAHFNFSSSLRVVDFRNNEEIGANLQKWLLHSNMSSLVRFDASTTGMNGSIAAMFFKLPNLEELYLFNNFFTELPPSIANLNASLQIFDLSDNLISGGIPTEMGLLQNLRELDLGNYPKGKVGGSAKLKLFPVLGNSNRLQGALPHSLCHLKQLVKLSFRYNLLTGTIPECLGLLMSLETLLLDHNRLQGNLPSTFGQLSNLRTLHLGSNILEGLVLESHFRHLTQLEELDFSSNFLKIQLPSNWVPPFKGQLEVLYLDSCVVGPDYPPWIRMLKSLARVGLSSTSIEGFLPHWFSESSCVFQYLDLSINKIQGKMQNIYDCSNESFSKSWDLSRNYLHGPIPSLNATFDFLSLSLNQFEGSISSRLISDDIVRYSIDLSDNQLIGGIPSSIGNCTNLQTVDLSGNHLSGQLPVSMGNIQSLTSLHLGDNNLSGTLPPELSNITYLMTLDIGGNKFTGRIPKWIGESLWNLRFLRLRSNFFSMEIPQELMSLGFLCVLDLANNQLSGIIPHSIGNLTTMRTKQSELTDLLSFYPLSGERTASFEERLDVERNSISYKYTKTLSLLASLDLANNNLSGEIPAELTHLIGLIVLNLSHNQFSGLIPKRIGNLINLDSLDLSENRLSGKIPFSLTYIPRLAHLNLSHNNLSGNIPSSPQLQTLIDPSIYAGNLGLCGFPLNKCEGNKTNATSSKPRHTGEKNVGIYVSVVAGFIIGFWCFFVPILFKRSLRILYFGYIDRVIYSRI